MKNCFTALLVFLLSFQLALAQKGFFEETSLNDNSRARAAAYVSRFSVVRIHIADLKNYLRNASIKSGDKKTSGLVLEVPLPNGKTELFEIVETPMLAPAVALKHPEIKTYSGTGTQHPNYSIRVNFTSSGFSGIVLGVESDAIYFEKLRDGASDNLYQSYFSRDAVSPATHREKNENNRCGALDSDKQPGVFGMNRKGGRASASTPTGATLRTFRLAMAADAEFTAQKGGTQLSAFNALTNYVNNLNAVYQKELSIAFMLVSDESLVYTNAATDPFDNNDQGLMLTQNQTLMDSIIGGGNYDVGHVLGYTGGSGGGVAVRPSVCDPGTKGQGASGVGDGSFAEVFDFQLVAHEIGHQFGMSHTYNSNIPVCTTRAYETSVEPGGGTTIMSYGFTCNNTNAADGLTGDDDYETPYAPFLNFHAVSLDQANDYVATLSCFTTTSTGNAIPVIAPMTTSYTVPKSTPFVLNGTASDADASNVLSYAWEGMNISDESDKQLLTATTISDNTKPPFFRSYLPVLSNESTSPGKRYYPRLSAILDGSNYAKGDKLPSVGIVTTHRLTVRDNQGGVTSAEVAVNISDTAGPFLITNDPSGMLAGNSNVTIQWGVNGTTAAPINCTLVDIFLSTDGGVTFPVLLAGAVPNSGSATVTLPGTATAEARIKVASSTSTASGNSPNIFFDISNQNFSIESPTPVRLIAFHVSQEEPASVLLSWKTTEEVNNLGFAVEMSRDSRSFEGVGFVNGKGGRAINQYQFTVRNLLAGTYYFRLKQVDLDGRYEYSPVRTWQIDGNGTLAFLYPNPAGNTVRINGRFGDNSAARVFDHSGRLVLTSPATQTDAYLEVDVRTLNSGLYLLNLTGEGLSKNYRFMKR